MTVFRQIPAALAVAATLATPAAAQDAEWLRRLEEQIARQTEALTRALESQLTGGRRSQTTRERGAEVTETFSRTVRLGRNGTVDLQNTSGDIVVTGAGGDNVRIEAVKRVRSRTGGDARAALEAVQIQVVERGGNVEVRTEHARRRNASAAVDYTVTVPNRANVTLRTVSGSVRVNNVRGELRAESVNGDITASAVDRLRSLRSVSGALRISDAEGEEIEGATVNGDVTLTNVKARALDLRSVSGSLRFSGVESLRAAVRSFNGDIEYAGPLEESGRYELQSHAGSVRVMPSGNTGFDVEATTFNGNVRSDYALTLQDAASAGLGLRPGPNRTNRALRGRFGNAGAALVLQTFNGDITIIRR